jgi:hypothetical protein
MVYKITGNWQKGGLKCWNNSFFVNNIDLFFHLGMSENIWVEMGIFAVEAFSFGNDDIEVFLQCHIMYQ